MCSSLYFSCFSQAKQEDLRKIYRIYSSLSVSSKKGASDRIIEEIVRRLNATGHSTLRRKIRNFVRSLANFGKKVSMCSTCNGGMLLKQGIGKGKPEIEERVL